ncbi:MAG: hypothetical protein ACI9MR_000491 [Myxococcota bacterium]
MWWPPSHRRDGGTLARDGDLVVDRLGDHNRALARIVMEQPGRIVLDWFLGSGPDRPSRALVTFSESQDRPAETQVRVRHTRGALSGSDYDATAVRFDGGWTALLDAFSAAASTA